MSRLPAWLSLLPLVALYGSAPAAGSSATQVISPTVVASWIAEEPPGESATLRVLVLWRGTPGWFRRPGASSGSGSSSASSIRGGASGVIRETITQGGVTVTFDYDPAKHVATINGKPIGLGDRNVILVDDVDSAAGARVAGMLRINSRMPGSAGQIGLAMRASPEILAYLRCDARTADPVANMSLERMCLENLGVGK